MTAEGWRAGYDLLAARVAMVSAALRETAALADPPVGLDLRRVRRLVATGVGSSEAHARFLAHLLAEHAGVDARYLPPSALVAPPPRADEDAVVVFSQGLSPNARLVLDERRRWRHTVVVTAAGEADAEKARLLAAYRHGGVAVVRFAGEEEYGTLARVVGPAAGYVRAYRLADELARASGAAALPALDLGRIEAARVAAVVAVDALDAGALAAPLVLVASGAYGELVANLRYKVMEGMLRPPPPVWDLLHVAHGPFQQAFAGPATFVVLGRADAPLEEALCGRLAHMLDPARHRLVRLVATLPGPLAILEHEAAFDALLLRDVRARHVDQVRWPGRGREAPLYDVASTRRLDERTWPEVETLVARGCRTAVLGLGSTEQHGPHLPLAADTWIADALAERFCARVEEAVQVPALGLGCAAEHLAFPGTLDLRPGTLAAVLGDVIASLGRHGFTRVFVFSAHGGNVAPLRTALPALRAACAPVEVFAFTDLDALTAALHGVAAAEGVAGEAAGHHAGEVETSILLALRPGAVRASRLAAGLVAPLADPQAIFYPSLRAHAESGTVGDPRGADAARGTRYLAAWVDLLVEAYRREKKSP